MMMGVQISETIYASWMPPTMPAPSNWSRSNLTFTCNASLPAAPNDPLTLPLLNIQLYIGACRFPGKTRPLLQRYPVMKIFKIWRILSLLIQVEKHSSINQKAI